MRLLKIIKNFNSKLIDLFQKVEPLIVKIFSSETGTSTTITKDEVLEVVNKDSLPKLKNLPVKPNS